MKPLLPTFVDFFAGSGLVTQGVKYACAPVWANDICPRKAAIYTANHGQSFVVLKSRCDSTPQLNPLTSENGVWAFRLFSKS